MQGAGACTHSAAGKIPRRRLVCGLAPVPRSLPSPTWEGGALGGPQQEAQRQEGGDAGGERKHGGHGAPGHNVGRQPDVGAQAGADHRGRHLEEGVGDEEEGGAQAVGGAGEVQVAVEVQRRKRQVGAVKVAEDAQGEEPGD